MAPLDVIRQAVKERNDAMRRWALRCAYDERDVEWVNRLFPPQQHVIDDGDGVCGDCLWCQENVESDCIVPDDSKCAWCGHCLGNHADKVEIPA
jgi:hypothetical protein